MIRKKIKLYSRDNRELSGNNSDFYDNKTQENKKILSYFFMFACLITSLFAGYIGAIKIISIFDTGGVELKMRLVLIIIIFITIFISSFCLIIVVCESHKSKSNGKFLSLFFEYNGKKTIFLTIFIAIQLLNWTGFCYEEKRFLKKEEIIQRVVAIDRDEDLEIEYKKNPYCCELRNNPQFLSGIEIFINNLFGHLIYEVDAYYKLNNSRSNANHETHYMEGIYTNSCASKTFRTYGIGILEEEYQSNINRIKNHLN